VCSVILDQNCSVQALSKLCQTQGTLSSKKYLSELWRVIDPSVIAGVPMPKAHPRLGRDQSSISTWVVHAHVDGFLTRIDPTIALLSS
jgi:hypothetical protein